ncbi:MAG: hypothetical protein IJB68_08270 [Ruminococcus sp.]|nr:hypothetical protein [Ruminococcus sp.]
MKNTVKNINDKQDKQMNDAIASKIAVENHKKYTELLLKKEVEKAIRGEDMPRE